MLYRPIYGSRGQFLWPRFNPGVELDTSLGGPMDGQISSADSDWSKYAIYNDPNHVVSPSDIEFADTINPADISTWNGNLSAFRDRAGKLSLTIVAVTSSSHPATLSDFMNSSHLRFRFRAWTISTGFSSHVPMCPWRSLGFRSRHVLGGNF